MLIKNNYSFLNEDNNNINCENNTANFTYQGGDCKFDENNQYQNSRELLNDMKNMIHQIDVKINNEMDCNNAY